MATLRVEVRCVCVLESESKFYIVMIQKWITKLRTMSFSAGKAEQSKTFQLKFKVTQISYLEMLNYEKTNKECTFSSDIYMYVCVYCTVKNFRNIFCKDAI